MHEEVDAVKREMKTNAVPCHPDAAPIPEDVDEANDFPERDVRFHVRRLTFDSRTTTTSNFTEIE